VNNIIFSGYIWEFGISKKLSFPRITKALLISEVPKLWVGIIFLNNNFFFKHVLKTEGH